MKERSLFFPLALIAAGTLWILISMGKIPPENVWALAHFWPFLLIAAGIGLILRSYWAPARMVMDVLVVGAAVLAIVYAPQLGWTTPQWGFGMGANFTGATPGSGKVISTTREVSGFQALSISYPAEVLIQQGAAESVKLEAEDNLIPQLSTETEMGTLHIKNKVSDWAERVNPTKPVRITITVKDLRDVDFAGAGTLRIEKLATDALSVQISGAGTLTMTELNTRSLDCRLNGAGSMTIAGVADTLKLNISGVGSFDGAALLGDNANVNISGAGSATVHPKSELVANVNGAGSVRYFGDPKVTGRVNGLGSVNKIEQ